MSKLARCKVCSKAEAAKYRCPLDGIDYCSVACFKQHKLTGCSSENTYVPPILPLIPQEINTHVNDDDHRPSKRLKDLHWPLEPSEALWDDPLSRNDLKPLRAFEYEAIATSPSLRLLLSSPSLISTLDALRALASQPDRERSLRLLLSLDANPSPAYYRPSTAPSARFSTSSAAAAAAAVPSTNPTIGGRGDGGRGRGVRGGRGGSSQRGGRGRNEESAAGEVGRWVGSTADERQKVVQFAEELERILAEARSGKRV